MEHFAGDLNLKMPYKFYLLSLYDILSTYCWSGPHSILGKCFTFVKLKSPRPAFFVYYAVNQQLYIKF